LQFFFSQEQLHPCLDRALTWISALPPVRAQHDGTPSRRIEMRSNTNRKILLLLLAALPAMAMAQHHHGAHAPAAADAAPAAAQPAPDQRWATDAKLREGM